MKKILYLSILLLSVLMISCKPDPIDNGDDTNNNDNPSQEEPLVRKYLTKQLLNDDPEKIMLSIDWNEDCSQIKNVKYSMGYGSTANYKFTYYDYDSVKIDISILDELPNWTPYYDEMMIHLNEEKNIDKIYCYVDNVLQDIEKYVYDENGKLQERIYWNDEHRDKFEWTGDNVTKAVIDEKEYSYELIIDFLHPHYTIPFYMSDQIFETGGRPFLTPLWENMVKDNCNYEIDEDNYIVKKIYKDKVTDTVRLFYSYYYITPSK